MYNERVQGVLSQHNPDTPLFLYLAPQDAHGTDQTLPKWSSLYVLRSKSPLATKNLLENTDGV